VYESSWPSEASGFYNVAHDAFVRRSRFVPPRRVRLGVRVRLRQQQMSLLFKHLRVHQVFGANTDVGKTILTTGLVRASAAKKNRVFYLKPVSTGPMQDADDE